MVGNTETRAKLTAGSSNETIYQMVLKALEPIAKGGTIVDVGCGQGNLLTYVKNICDRYIGVDVVRYEGFPSDREFRCVNLDSGKVELPDNCAEIVCSVETIEHLENPRAFVRELSRLVKPNGIVVITTPNQLSLLSKLTLILKNQFNAFQDSLGLYTAHITALLEIDLIRIFAECGLIDIQVAYSNQGRIPFTSKTGILSFKVKLLATI
jgi:ubiquinone/menaquinone biosynthesis C-methylase UbiE